MSSLQNRIRRYLNVELSTERELLRDAAMSLDCAAKAREELEAEIERLRELVKTAYTEGASDESNLVDPVRGWALSDSRQALVHRAGREGEGR